MDTQGSNPTITLGRDEENTNIGILYLFVNRWEDHMVICINLLQLALKLCQSGNKDLLVTFHGLVFLRPSYSDQYFE